MTRPTLTEEIADFEEHKRQRMAPEVLQTMDRHTQLLADSGLIEQAMATLSVDQSLPLVSLPAVDGQLVALADLLQNGPLVLVYYRGGWCPYCNLELRAWAQQWPVLRELGASLVAISPEKPEAAVRTQQRNDLGFPVLVDEGMHYARRLGIVFRLHDELAGLYRKLGIDLAENQGEPSQELPLPITVILRPDGRVHWRFVDADYTRRAEPADVVHQVRVLVR